MVFTDGIHIVADSLNELHQFCNTVGIKKCWFEGVEKGHPHYDIPKRQKVKRIFLEPNVKRITTRELLKISKEMK